MGDVVALALFGLMFGLGAFIGAVWNRVDLSKLEEKVKRVEKIMGI